MPHTPVVQYAIDLQFFLKDCSGINKLRDKVLYFIKDSLSNQTVVGVTYQELRECMEEETIPQELKQYLK